MLDWLIQPKRQTTAPTRRARRRRAELRLLPSAPSSQTGGGMEPDPFSLYPCTRMHGADFDAEFNAASSEPGYL